MNSTNSDSGRGLSDDETRDGVGRGMLYHSRKGSTSHWNSQRLSFNEVNKRLTFFSILSQIENYLKFRKYGKFSW